MVGVVGVDGVVWVHEVVGVGGVVGVKKVKCPKKSHFSTTRPALLVKINIKDIFERSKV